VGSSKILFIAIWFFLSAYAQANELKRLSTLPLKSLITGKPVSKFSHNKDKPKLVIFWASWCPHCAALANRLSKTRPIQQLKFEIIAISVDKDRSAGLAASKRDFQFATDHFWAPEAMGTYLESRVIPMVLILSNNGEVDTIYRDGSGEKVKSMIDRMELIAFESN
jgi:thiol-disulfide isomerase/thioredoxin